MSKAIVQIKEVKRPNSGKRIGERILVTAYNMDRWDAFSQSWCPSFAKSYLIAESGDYPEVTKEILAKFLFRIMRHYKISEFVEP